MWFNRHPLNNSLVVFVHGFFGGSWGTWLGVPGIIQSMAEHDPWVRSYDFYSFQYDSTAFHQPPLIPFAEPGSTLSVLDREFLCERNVPSGVG